MTEPTQPAIALSQLQRGHKGIVNSLEGGRDFCSRLANHGFTAGTPVTVMQNHGHGPMLVSVRGVLVALGRAEAARVLVCAGEA